MATLRDSLLSSGHMDELSMMPHGLAIGQLREVGWRHFEGLAAEQVKRFELNPKDIGIPKPPDPPPGQPIGCESN